MGLSAVRLAANRANALKSTGPRTVGGKEASRRNALTHGLSGRGIVIPGEDENEVAVRIEALEPELAPEGDVMARLLVRQVAVLTVRHERGFRHESATLAERMRQAADSYDDARRAAAEQLLDRIAIEPATSHRRLMATPEGVDCLLGRLRALRATAAPRPYIQWSENDGYELNLCMGQKITGAPSTRAYLLTQGILLGNWAGIDPAELEDLGERTRPHWGMAELHKILGAEIARLEAHRGTLNLADVARSRAEAAERVIVDTGPDGLTLRRFQAATERSMLKILRELRVMRYEGRCRAVDPAEVVEVLDAMAAEMPELQEVAVELASFSPAPTPPTRSGPRSALASALADPKSSYVPITAGLAPPKLPRPAP